MKLPTLTLTQPYAMLTMIDDRPKRVETRSWHRRYRGWVGIHAASGLGPVGGLRGLWNLSNTEPFCSALQPYGLPIGCVLGVAYLAGIFQFNAIEHPNYRVVTEDRIEHISLDKRELAFGDYAYGRFGWLLKYPHRFDEPVPAKGKQGLWSWDVPVDLEYLVTGKIGA